MTSYDLGFVTSFVLFLALEVTSAGRGPSNRQRNLGQHDVGDDVIAHTLSAGKSDHHVNGGSVSGYFDPDSSFTSCVQACSEQGIASTNHIYFCHRTCMNDPYSYHKNDDHHSDNGDKQDNHADDTDKGSDVDDNDDNKSGGSSSSAPIDQNNSGLKNDSSDIKNNNISINNDKLNHNFTTPTKTNPFITTTQATTGTTVITDVNSDRLPQNTETYTNGVKNSGDRDGHGSDVLNHGTHGALHRDVDFTTRPTTPRMDEPIKMPPAIIG